MYRVKSDGFTTKSSEKYYDLVLHEHINENQISSQTKHKTYEIETKSKPRRAQEGRVSFPIQSQYKDSKIHSSNPTLEEKGRKNRREGERRTGGRGRRRQAGRGSVLFQALRERERGGVRGYLWCPHRGPKYP